MTYYDIEYYEPINETESDKVDELARSILTRGWQGMPILTWYDTLVTGSHRLAALKRLREMRDDAMWEDSDDPLIAKIGAILDDDNIALDVTDIIEDGIEEEKEVDTRCLRKIFAGTEIEVWENELDEW